MQSAVQSRIDIDAWRKRIRDDTFANYHIQMGIALRETGDMAAAVAMFERALAITPSDVLANHGVVYGLQQLGRHSEAEAALHRALEHVPDFQLQALLRYGRTLITYNRTGKARHVFAEALSLRPGNREAMVFLEYLDMLDGLPASVGFRPEDAADLAPDLVEVLGTPYMKLAGRFIRESRIPEAMEAFERGISFCPSLSTHMYNVGMLYWATGQLTRVAGVLEVLARHNDDLPTLWNWLGQTLLALGRTNEAMEAHQRALALNGQDHLSLLSVANMLQVEGHLDDAAAMYHRTSEIYPTDAWPLSGLGLVEIAAGRAKEGLALQQETLNRFPGARSVPWLGTNIALAEWHNGLENAALTTYGQTIAGGAHILGFQARLRPWALEELTTAYKTLKFDPMDLRHVVAVVRSL